MKNLLLINVAANSGSTGRIAHQIGELANENGYSATLAYGRIDNNSKINTIKIGNEWDVRWHGVVSRLFDNHGFGSTNATKYFIKEIERIQPDVINIHNLHGYYINVEILFDYLSTIHVPIVWTFHDCWPFTGHCSHFDFVSCNKWQTRCNACPNQKGYPASLFFDNSGKNYDKKKKLFTSVGNMTLVTPSHWLEELTRKSFLNKYPVQTIHNGVDLNVFSPLNENKNKLLPTEKKIILGVANQWDQRKGLVDFIQLSTLLDDTYQIVLVGVSSKQIATLPPTIMGIQRTENVTQLAELYSLADVFVNPTYVDNFPTTNIEALACGTPVITYNTGGSPEAVDNHTGMVVEKSNIVDLKIAIEHIVQHKEQYATLCRKRAVKHFNQQERFMDYINLFNQLTVN